MATRVHQQIENILGNADSDRHSVIVRVEAHSEETRNLLELATSVIQERNMTLTARDVLPEQRAGSHPVPQVQGQGMSFTNTANIESVRSLAARVARQSESSTATTASLKANSMESLNSLLKSKIVRQASREAAKLNNTKPGSVVHPFWAANSALIDISSSDLQRLPEEVPEVRGIYVNRKLGVPRLVEARNLPATVLENKASAWGVNKIGALSVWGAYGARGRGVRVGVLDTGVDDKHPDLKGKIVAWAEFDSEGKKVAGSKAHDSDKHGTHCSGIIAGGNSSGQWIGVAPEAELAVALVLNGDQGGTVTGPFTKRGGTVRACS